MVAGWVVMPMWSRVWWHLHGAGGHGALRNQSSTPWCWSRGAAGVPSRAQLVTGASSARPQLVFQASAPLATSWDIMNINFLPAWMDALIASRGAP